MVLWFSDRIHGKGEDTKGEESVPTRAKGRRAPLGRTDLVIASGDSTGQASDFRMLKGRIMDDDDIKILLSPLAARKPSVGRKGYH